MTYLLDTNICIYLIKQQPASVLQRVQAVEIEEIGISSMTIAELEYGIAKSSRAAENRLALLEFLSPFRLVDFGTVASHHYGILRSALERDGKVIGPMDMLIAAHALAEEAVLVTNNEKEFKRIPNLRIENWV